MFFLSVTSRPFSSLLKRGGGDVIYRNIVVGAWILSFDSVSWICYKCPVEWIGVVTLHLSGTMWYCNSTIRQVTFQLQCVELQDCVRINSRNGWYLSPIWKCYKLFYRNFLWSPSHFTVVMQAVASQLLLECSKQYGGWYSSSQWQCPTCDVWVALWCWRIMCFCYLIWQFATEFHVRTNDYFKSLEVT